MKAIDKYGGNTGNPCQQFVLTESEYSQITQRILDSKKGLDMLKDCTTKESLKQNKAAIEQECSKMSLMVQVQTKRDSQRSGTIVSDVYEILVTEMYPSKKAFLVLMYNGGDETKQLMDNADYLIDKVRLIINKKGEICFVTTEHSVLIEYRRLNQNQEDSQSFGSDASDSDKDEYQYINGQNKSEPVDEAQAFHEKMREQNIQRENEEYQMYRDSDRPNAHRHPDNQGDWAG